MICAGRSHRGAFGLAALLATLGMGCGQDDSAPDVAVSRPAGIERATLGSLHSSDAFGHSWLDCEFGRFSAPNTKVEARRTADGLVEVVVGGAWIPKYWATFTFDPDEPDADTCGVEVSWFRDSGFDHELSGRMTVLEAYVWSSGVEVHDDRIATHFAFSITGLREDEPVTVSGEALLE
jgi:hypothetical protein